MSISCAASGRSIADVVIEPVRAILIPGFQGVKKAALDSGALGCSISGSGPAVFALTRGRATAQRAGDAMAAVNRSIGIDCDVYISGINRHGAVVREACQ